MAAELGRSVQDCVSRSTLLHLQELERTSRVPSPTKAGGGGQQPPPQKPTSPPPPAPAAPLAAGKDGVVPGKAPTSPAGPSGARGGLLASEVAALARRHGFDWAAVGA